MEDYAEGFQKMLHCADAKLKAFSVVTFFSTEHEESAKPRSPNEIVALPAGRNPAELLVHGTRCDGSIFVEMLKKCDRDAIPALLQLRRLTPPLVRHAARTIVPLTSGLASAAIGAILYHGTRTPPMTATTGFVTGMALYVAMDRLTSDDPMLIEIHEELKKLEASN